MINHHPTSEVLNQFVAGSLPASVSVVVASHVELCHTCRQSVAQLTQHAATEAFDEGDMAHDLQIEDELSMAMVDVGIAPDMMASIDAITQLEPDQSANLPQTVTEIEVSGQRIALPRAMKSIGLTEWQGLGKLSRSRLVLEDGDLRASLLHIDKGGSVPCHTHKGFEITLLLQGSFDDDMGHYQTGDFMWLDGNHTHQPVTQEGCVCLTVSSDAIHFTQGMSQLLNPIGRFIY